MKWEDRGRSKNLDDRRASAGPVGRGIPLGIGGILIIVALSAITGTDLFALLGINQGGSTTTTPATQQELAEEEEQVRFVSFVLDDIQETWSGLVSGGGYPDATLVLYRDAVESGCGVAPSAAGPFYCPNDQMLYIDLSFYDTLRERYGAPGDFAQAYVIAHEVGHHVQNLVGTLGEMRQQQQARPAQANALSVALELQADCYAGVWAASADARGIMERGDIEEGLGAAAAVGDDRLSSQAGRTVNQETFTHGSSQQRMQWFTTGFQSGDPNACDTFAAL
ncbi:MAG TPA: neutral zinc metallopeptidase [Trueperaceae bacterium]|nr:neutral zinc metallopeptidase [Trueperaceae bacterium]